MEARLFTDEEIEKYLFEIVFHGPSYDGVMEIDALAKEIQGLEDVLKKSIAHLKKARRIDFGLDDYVIYIAAFEKSSFKKQVLLFNKTTGEYQHLINLSTLLISIIALMATRQPAEIRDLPVELQSEIRDEVVLQLLRDQTFINSVAAVVKSVSLDGDTCTLTSPNHQSTTINPDASLRIQKLAEPVEQTEILDRYEEIPGRITKVDLDASLRHIGFKYNGEGTTIEATFTNKPDTEVLKTLLGEKVELRGIVTYKGDVRSHIQIAEYDLISQENLGLDNIAN